MFIFSKKHLEVSLWSLLIHIKKGNTKWEDISGLEEDQFVSESSIGEKKGDWWENPFVIKGGMMADGLANQMLILCPMNR